MLFVVYSLVLSLASLRVFAYECFYGVWVCIRVCLMNYACFFVCFCACMHVFYGVCIFLCTHLSVSKCNCVFLYAYACVYFSWCACFCVRSCVCFTECALFSVHMHENYRRGSFPCECDVHTHACCVHINWKWINGVGWVDGTFDIVLYLIRK